MNVSYSSLLLSIYMTELTVTPTKFAKLYRLADTLFRLYISNNTAGKDLLLDFTWLRAVRTERLKTLILWKFYIVDIVRKFTLGAVITLQMGFSSLFFIKDKLR